jgi:glutathione S-transferase
MLERGGDYFADGRLTIADLKVAVLTQWLMSGDLDHVPTDIVQKNAPRLVEHAGRVSDDPIVKAYNESRA